MKEIWIFPIGKLVKKNMKKDKLALPQQQDLRIRVNYYLKVNIYMKKEL